MTPTPNADAKKRALDDPEAVADWLTGIEGSRFLTARLVAWPDDNKTVMEIEVLYFDWFIYSTPVNKDNPALLKRTKHSREQTPALLIEKLHELGESLDRPPGGKSLLWAIMTRIGRQLLTRNDHDDRLFPNVWAKRENDSGGNYPAMKWAGIRNRGQLEFPSFGDTENGIVQQVLPPELYELPHRSRGRGAPLARRIFVNAILDVPQSEWQSVEPLNLPPMSFGRFLQGLYPPSEKSGRINWNPGKNLDDMLEAFDVLTSRQALVGWEDPDTGIGGADLVVIPLTRPRDGHVDDIVRLQVNLPPGTGDRGVIFDRPALIQAGARSAPAFDLATSLAPLWSVPGKTRIPKGGTWLQVRKSERYPEVSDAMLAAMTYPAGNYPTDYKRTAEKALSYLVRIGYAEVVEVDETRRIKPGQNWAGWAK